MSNGSRPRPDSSLLYEASRKAVAYRLAMISALTELNPHNCVACRRAQMILEDVDRVTSAPPLRLPALNIPEPREDDDGLIMDALDVACAFRVSEQTVGDWLHNGKIPPQATFLDARGRRWFHTAEIDKLLA